MILKCVIFLLAFLATAWSKQISYEGYQVYRLTPSTQEHVQLILEADSRQYHFADGPVPVIGKSSDIVIHPTDGFFKTLKGSRMQMELVIDNLQTLIDTQKVNTEPLKDGRLEWDRYYPLNDIYAFVEAQADAHSSFAKVSTIGQSYEGRDLKMLTLSKSNETNPVIWIDSTIHSREWITGAVCTYLIDQLLNNDDSEIQSWLDNFDFYILPVANPDGYDHTHRADRLWRKTRSINEGSPCIGTDPNRNFDFHHLEPPGASTDPCSNAYGGAYAFSEPECAAMGNMIDQLSEGLVFYLSLHSSGQYILIPYGNSSERIPDYDEYMRIGGLAAEAHAEKYGTIFEPGNVVDLLYIANGISMDWVKETYNTPLTYTYEMRDKGQYGHLLPPDQILPSSEEFMDGFRVLMRELQNMISKKA